MRDHLDEDIGDRTDIAGGDVLAAQHAGADFQRRLGVEMLGLGQLLAQDGHLSRLIVDGGDAQQRLSMRRRARQRIAPAQREIDRSGNDRVDGGDAGKVDHLHLKLVVAPDPGILGDIGGEERHDRRRLGEARMFDGGAGGGDKRG